MATIYPDKDYEFPQYSDYPRLLDPQEILTENKEKSYPLDIEALIKEYNIEILKEDMDYDISGYIEQRGRKWTIGINKYHSKKRQRFTMAHEFAHYVLHRGRIELKHKDMALFRNNEINPIEVEANNFAGELLMPREKFKRYIADGMTKISDLSEKFDVSISAIRYKAYRLGYLNSV